MDDFALVERSPTHAELESLRGAVGWVRYEIEQLGFPVIDILYDVCVLHDCEVVGFGRVAGEEGVRYYIQEIMVLPEFQGRGIGRRLMDAIVGYLDANAPPGAWIGLVASRELSGFYEEYGFEIRREDRSGLLMRRKT